MDDLLYCIEPMPAASDFGILGKIANTFTLQKNVKEQGSGLLKLKESKKEKNAPKERRAITNTFILI